MVLESLYSWNFDQVEWLPADPTGNTKTKYGLSALPTVYKPTNDILPSVANTGYADFAFTRMPAIAINKSALGTTETIGSEVPRNHPRPMPSEIVLYVK